MNEDSTAGLGLRRGSRHLRSGLEYDVVGRLSEVLWPQSGADPTKTSATHEYDDYGRLEQTTFFDADENRAIVAAQSHDANGNVTSQTVTAGGSTSTVSRTFDALDRGFRWGYSGSQWILHTAYQSGYTEHLMPVGGEYENE